ncbi:hypothetical protein CVT26_002764 [Gymnopilus dilepis]|uniref:TAFII55 protein conserved region domain-containing protein n=1 Tax=Gymnopilus dilepis TaxID=231916 RepID=A0A409VC86_9AGAR|nr:hypothetical protein CVT26_002764 [Gymnopilus dilepis]
MDYVLPSPEVVLHVYPGQWDLPSFDPLCAAALLYLQLAIPGKFIVRTCPEPDSSPIGQLPFLVHEQHVVYSFTSIVKYVAGLRGTSTNADLDAHLSPSERSQRNAWFSHVESHLGDLVYHNLYVNHENWTHLTQPALATTFPVPQKYYVPQRIRNTYYPRLLASGLWREHVEEKPLAKTSLRDKFEAKKQELGKHPAMSRAFEKEKVLEKARADLDIYKELLGDRTYFFHERPSSLDVLVASHILLLVEPPLPDTLVKELIINSYPALAAHARRIYDLAFKTDKPLPTSTQQSPSLWSLLPYWPRRKKTQQVQKAAEKEDVQFTRMTWGFVGLALGSLAAYLFIVARKMELQINLGGDDTEIADEEEEEFIDEMNDNDDLIVIDDIENEAGPSNANGSAESRYATRPKTVAEHNLGSTTTSRLRSGSNASTENPNPERSTRSSTRSKSQPKLKLKLGEKAASQAPGMSFLGPYDRELDSDDEDLAFEEQFILRMPPGEDCEKLRKAIQSREIGNDIWFKFKDSRRAVFHIGNNLYSAKLVDLPCIVESQKTLDGKQMFKVADICQMLVVEKKIPSEESLMKDKSFNIDEFIWPHGITPPLHHVRKRRFRKRVNRRTIESVEQEVERLLDEDTLATESKYEVLENVNPDLSDSELMEQDHPLDAPTPALSDLGDGQTPGDLGEGEEEEEEAENEEGEGDIDEELAAELDLALENGEDEEGEGDDEEEEEESEEEDSDDEDDEETQSRKLLNEEIRDLEAAVAKKRNEIASSANPLIRKRFEDALKKLTADLDMKIAQRDELKERQRMKKEGITMENADTDQDNMGHDGDMEGDDELFGNDSEMDIN